MRFNTRVLLLSAAATLVVASTSALADGSAGSSSSPTSATTTRQGPSAPGTPKAEDSRKIEKVTVTATRRRTAAQKTPVPVTVIGKQTLDQAKVKDITALQNVVPTLMVTNGGNPAAYTARIRGVGTQGNNAGLESAVGTFIDGVYRARAAVAFGDLGEIQQIEVLRGPQGTTFGRNTSAGVINVMTAPPAFENMINGTVTAGDYGMWGVSGSANGVISDDELAVRLFATRQKRDGYIDVNPGRPDSYDGNSIDYWSTRGQMLFQIGNEFDFRLIADYSKRDDQCCSAGTIDPTGQRRPTSAVPAFRSATGVINYLTGPLPGKATAFNIGQDVAFGDASTQGHTQDYGFSGEMNWDIGVGNLTSVTAWRNWHNDYAQDADFSGADILYYLDDGTNFTDFKDFTQEFRLAGETSWADWLIGAFYANEDISRRVTLKNGKDIERFLSLEFVGDLDTPGVAPYNSLRSFAALFYTGFAGYNVNIPTFTSFAGDDDHYKQNSESMAAFTHNTIHLTDDLDLTLGARYTHEKKVFDATYRTNASPGCAAVEARFGYNPVGFAPYSTGAAPVATLLCLPGARHALDVLTAVDPHHQERSENEWSGLATLSYDYNEDIHAYLTVGRGHKAGGFNLDRSYSDALGSIVSGPVGAQTIRGPDTSFAPEFVDDLELGLKMQLLDDTLQVNIAGFAEKFKNYQLNTFTGISFVVTSVPEMISKGFEVESFYKTPIPGLTTTLNLAYTDARYTHDLGCIWDGVVGSPTQAPCLNTFLGQNPGLFLLPGHMITHAPKYVVGGGVDYEFPIFDTGWGALAHTDFRWQSRMITGSNLDPRKEQDGFGLMGLSFTAMSPSQTIGFQFFVRNLFDERYINTAFDSPLQGSNICDAGHIVASICSHTPHSGTNGTSTIDAFLGEPRMMGASLSVYY